MDLVTDVHLQTPPRQSKRWQSGSSAESHLPICSGTHVRAQVHLLRCKWLTLECSLFQVHSNQQAKWVSLSDSANDYGRLINLTPNVRTTGGKREGGLSCELLNFRLKWLISLIVQITYKWLEEDSQGNAETTGSLGRPGQRRVSSE